MKEDYMKIVLLALIAVVAIQGYYLYDMRREGVASEEEVRSPLSLVPAPKDMKSFETLFDKAHDPFSQMERLQREMEQNLRDFDDFFQNESSFDSFFSRSDRSPRFNMKEHRGSYIITVEIPGSEKQSIDVKAEDGRLTISSKVMEEVEDNATTYYRHERRASSYKREIILPDDADETSLRTEYKDGVLTITLEKLKR